MTARIAQLTGPCANRFETARRIVATHYGLSRRPDDVEVNAEITSILRKRERGTMDDRAEMLCARLEIAGVI